MGKRQRLKAATLEDSSSSEEVKRKRKSPNKAASDDDEAEANEDLSLKIVQKSVQRAAKNYPREVAVPEFVTNLKDEKSKKEKKKRKKNKEVELPADSVSIESRFIYWENVCWLVVEVLI